jgi:hypothetical protein
MGDILERVAQIFGGESVQQFSLPQYAHLYMYEINY